MMRHIISATSSSPTCQVIFWVMKKPSPSAVCFGPTTSVSSATTLTSSPGRRYRWYVCSQLVATTPMYPASSNNVMILPSGSSSGRVAAQAEHRPHLNHGRRSDNSRMSGRAGRGLVDVDRVLVADRVEPVVDHRLIDRMAATPRLALALGLDPLGGLLDVFDAVTAAPSAPSGPTPRSSPSSLR